MKWWSILIPVVFVIAVWAYVWLEARARKKKRSNNTQPPRPLEGSGVRNPESRPPLVRVERERHPLR